MKNTKLFLAVMLAGFSSLSVVQAQTARLEVIHNAADGIASVVDVYVNGGATPFIDDFEFRTTSGFVDVPAGVDLNIGIALSTSTGPGDILFMLPAINLVEGETYIAIANGIVSPTGYMPSSVMAPFGLDVFAAGQEGATGGAGTNDVLVYHGATDAPNVNVAETALSAGAVVVPNIAYSEFQEYLALGVEDYTLQVQAASSGGAVAAFDAPLATLGFDGAALTILASGFLDPSVNSGGPAFGLWVSTGVAGPLLQLPTPTARLEVIHNSPDPLAAIVDIFIDGNEAISDLAFRTTTGFIDIPAGMPLSIEVAPDGAGLAGALPAIDIPFLASGETYIAIANGFADGTNFSPAPSFALDIYTGAREAAAAGAGANDVLVYHGSTDAPTVDVDELVATMGAEVVSDLSYGEFITNYLELGVANYTLQVQADASGAAVAAYYAALADLGLDGTALTVLASGFLSPNTPVGTNVGPAFGLFVSTGVAGPLLELQAPTARVEIIHNAADTLLDVVDVYVNGDLAVPGFEFRTSTGFIDLPAGMPLDINAAPAGVGLGGSVDLADIPFLFPDSTYITIANGTVSPGYITPQPLGLGVYVGAREAVTSGLLNTDVLVYHGSTDAPNVDVNELSVVSGQIIDDLGYGMFEDDYLGLPTANYLLQITGAGSPVGIAAYDAPLAALNLEGAAITVLASGFFNPDNEGAGFGLWVSTGAAGPLVELPSPEARIEIIHNSSDAAAAVVDVFVNGEEAVPDFAYRTSTGFITLPAGMPLSIEIAPDGAGLAGALPAINIPFLASGETYIAIANGIVSGSGYAPDATAAPFALDIYADAREVADGGAGTNDVLVYHGATDAPMVDVDELSVVMGEVVNDLSYSEFQGYLALGVEDYMLQVQAASSGGAVAAFDAPLATLGVDGAALTVIASGFLVPSVNSNGPAFGLWVSTGAAGPLLELPMSMARLEVIHNSADAGAAVVDVFVNGGELIPDFAFRTTTGFIDVPAGMPLSIEVAPDGAGIAGALPSIDIPFLGSGETYIAIANGILPGSTGYSETPAFGLDIYAEAREAATSGGTNTDVLVYHGSTDAPTVDVSETGFPAGLLVNDISYGEFNADGYLELASVNYELTIQDETGAVNVATFSAPLATLMTEGAALTVLASGFLSPEDDNNGAGFGLWVSLGTEGDLIPLSNVTGIEDVESISNASLYPNPTNDNATLFFDLTDDTNINLEVVNMMGQQVVVRSFGEMLSGNHRVEIPASELTAGFYFINLRTQNGVVSSKLQVVK
jgi:hypothetical protein